MHGNSIEFEYGNSKQLPYPLASGVIVKHVPAVAAYSVDRAPFFAF